MKQYLRSMQIFFYVFVFLHISLKISRKGGIMCYKNLIFKFKKKNFPPIRRQNCIATSVPALTLNHFILFQILHDDSYLNIFCNVYFPILDRFWTFWNFLFFFWKTEKKTFFWSYQGQDSEQKISLCYSRLFWVRDHSFIT